MESSEDLAVTYREWMSACQRRYVEDALRRAGGNVTEACRASGLHRASFYAMMAKHGLLTLMRRRQRGNWERHGL
jgi:transcriptional regulator of acetoin/glycerol metabolism